MGLFIKSGSVWRNTSSNTHTKYSGVWRKLSDGFIKSGGVWRQFVTGAINATITTRGAASPSGYYTGGSGGVNVATYVLVSPLTMNVTFGGGNGSGNYAAVYFGPVTTPNLFVIAGGGGAYGSQNGAPGGSGGGVNGGAGGNKPTCSGGGGGVTNSSGRGPGGSGGSGGTTNARGANGNSGSLLQGAPGSYGPGGAGGYYGGGGGASDFDQNTGGGAGGGSGMIRNWSFPGSVVSMSSPSFSSGSNGGEASVNISINGTPYPFSGPGSVSV